MSPSSFVFVAVIAIWATYLVVHVARRREFMATARTVDRFSSQMRVLERRAATYTPPATSGRVSSARLSRSRSPLVASGTPDLLGVSELVVPAVDAGAEVAAVSVASAGTESAERTAAVPSPRAAVTGAMSSVAPARRSLGRRIRGGVLVATLTVTVITALLAALSLVSWFVPVVGLLLVGATVVSLRRAVVAERAARRRRLAAARRQRENAARLEREAALEARPSAPSFPVAQEYVAPAADAPSVVEVDTPVSAESRSTTALVGEVVASAEAESAQAAPAAAKRTAAKDEVFDRLFGEPEWEPTPVPAPTYTLKARAERPVPPPLDVPVPIEVEADEEYWSDEYGRPHAVNG